MVVLERSSFSPGDEFLKPLILWARLHDKMIVNHERLPLRPSCLCVSRVRPVSPQSIARVNRRAPRPVRFVCTTCLPGRRGKQTITQHTPRERQARARSIPSRSTTTNTATRLLYLCSPIIFLCLFSLVLFFLRDASSLEQSRLYQARREACKRASGSREEPVSRSRSPPSLRGFPSKQRRRR